MRHVLRSHGCGRIALLLRTVLRTMAVCPPGRAEQSSADTQPDRGHVAGHPGPSPAGVGRVTGGTVELDAYPGSDDDRLAAALVDIGQATLRPTLVLANRAHQFTRVHRLIRGLRISGPLGGLEREFRAQCVVAVAGPALFSTPAAGVKDISIRGVSFTGTGGNTWLEPVGDLARGPILEDADIEHCGWSNFATVMRARILRCRIDRTYTQGCSGTDFILAGSDNYLWLNGGYASSVRKDARPYGAPYLYFPHMSCTRVGPLYITPEGCRNAVVVDGSYRDLWFDGSRFDCTGRGRDKACQHAALHIAGGTGVIVDRCQFFNVAVADAATAVIAITGGADHVVRDCTFAGGRVQASHTPEHVKAVISRPRIAVTGLHSIAGGNVDYTLGV
jgi:hypothetical protein